MGRVPSRPGRRVALAAIAALAWSACLLVAAFAVPVYSGTHETALAGGAIRSVAVGSTLVAVNGLWVLGLVAVPAVITGVVGIALYMKRSRGSGAASFIAWEMIGLLSAFCLLGAFTIGLAIVPVAALLAYASARTPLGAG